MNLKKVANLLLISMFILYVVSVYIHTHYQVSWILWLKAMAEAGLAGAVADWFAVTALFRHPFNIKMPHTNILVNNKMKIANNIGSFIETDLLHKDHIQSIVEKQNIVLEGVKILQSKKELLKLKAVNMLTKLVLFQLNEKLNKEFISKYMSQAHIDKNLIISMTQQVEKLIKEIKLEDTIKNRVNLQLIVRSEEYKKEHKFMAMFINFESQIQEFSATFAKDFVNSLITEIQLLQLDNNKYKDIVNTKVTDFIENEVDTLREKFIQQAPVIIRNFIDIQYESLLDYLTANERKINNWITENIDKVINPTQIKEFIIQQVSEWNNEQFISKLETQVSNDLQFVRINGSIVGALVGLVIHTISVIM